MSVKKGNVERFLNLDKDKQNRIINAALEEFQYGYKKASTDAMVKKAGVSKGLIFHYFGSKEGLYNFIIDYAHDLLEVDYFDALKLGGNDILESIWQVAQRREDVSQVHPHIYNFLATLYIHIADNPRPEMAKVYETRYKNMLSELYNRCDLTLFRDDIDPKIAMDIIMCTLENFHTIYSGFDSDNWTDMSDDEHNAFLEETKKYLDVFRRCFYK